MHMCNFTVGMHRPYQKPRRLTEDHPYLGQGSQQPEKRSHEEDLFEDWDFTI